ncbi:MAG: response regulator transcription factor [Anaerolineae bacterium]
MSLRILLVERDVATSDLLVPSLERRGYQVFVAATQHQAIKRIRSMPPDLLVIDVASFGANGYKVRDAVRSHLSSAPMILLLDKGRTNAEGTADAYMTPPFTPRKLLYRIKKVSDKLSSREIRAGSLILDPDTRTLVRDEESFHLRPKEAALLAFFMRNPGRVLSRQEIMKQIWETEYTGDTRTLSVHVRWLRLKIETDPNAPRWLRTIRGLGYRFDVPDVASAK